MGKFLNTRIMNDKHPIDLIISAIAGWAVSVFVYFAPMHQLWLAMAVTWILNFAIGYYDGVKIKNEQYSKSKAMDTINEMLVYLLFTVLFFFLGDMTNDDKIILKGINVVTWGLMYIYIVNMLKNLKSILPNSKFVRYLYFIMTVEFIKKVPFMTEFNNNEKKGKNVQNKSVRTGKGCKTGYIER